MKPKLKRPRSKRLKLKCDVLLLNVGFKFSLRCYSSGLAPLVLVGPGRCCSPRERIPFDSIIEGPKRVSMTWR